MLLSRDASSTFPTLMDCPAHGHFHCRKPPNSCISGGETCEPHPAATCAVKRPKTHRLTSLQQVQCVFVVRARPESDRISLLRGEQLAVYSGGYALARLYVVGL